MVETRDGVPSNTDLAVLDSRGVASRFTFDPADDSGAVWSPDGSRIAWRNGGTGNNPGEAKVPFYVAPDGKLMAASVKLAATAEIGTPVGLFSTHMERGGTQTGGFWHQYDVSPDGTRFLVNTLADAAAGAGLPRSLPITVIVNWTATLKN